MNQPHDPQQPLQQPSRQPARRGARHDPSHPRDGGSSRRIVLAGAGTVTALVLLFGYHTSTESSAVASSAAASSVAISSGNAPSTTASASPSPTTTAMDSSTESSTDSSATSGSTTPSTPSSSTDSSAQGGAAATFTGDAADTRYGPVQVQIIVTSGKITAVDVVEYPTENHKDAEINARAVPTLVQETLSAQSADIDMVSGATYTSDGYLTSLQSALDQAKL